MKREREDDIDNVNPSPPAAPSPPSSAPAVTVRNNGAQYIEEKDEDTKIVRNSPYGTSRAALGWGGPFAQPKKCFHASFPHIYIGISSLNGTPGKDRDMKKLFQQYSRKYRVLEHCNPYHRMGDPSNWESWSGMAAGATPKNSAQPFVFAIKANQYLTHSKMLEVDEDTTTHIQNFFRDRCTIMGRHLGPVLVQLPPTFRKSEGHLQRIRAVAALIPAGIRIACEFRNKTWYCEETYAVLREVGWSFVVTHNEDTGESPFVITNPSFLYVRLHGAVNRFVGDYGPTLMQRWAEKIAEFVRGRAEGEPEREVFIFLNNNESQIGGLTSSVVDSTSLAESLWPLLLSGAAPPPPAVGRVAVEEGAASPLEKPLCLGVPPPDVVTID